MQIGHIDVAVYGAYKSEDEPDPLSESLTQVILVDRPKCNTVYCKLINE